MEKEKSQNQLVLPKQFENFPIVSKFDETLLSHLESRLEESSSIEDFQQTRQLIQSIQKDNMENFFTLKEKGIEIQKKQVELIYFKINKGFTVAIGLGLCVTSIFVIPINPVLGGVLLGTGLGAFGINTVSIKSLFNRNK